MSGTQRIGIIGAGVMGRALIQGLREAGDDVGLWAAVRTEQARREAEHALGIDVVADPGPRLAATDLVVVCVKPRDARAACERLAAVGTLPRATPVVSIAAGVGLRELEAALGPGRPAVRALPNTAIRVRRGATVLCPGAHADAGHLASVRRVFEAVGRCVELPEALIDAATAVGASGPAFVYTVVEAMADAAVGLGLPRGVALELAAQAAAGAAEMVRATGRHPAALRDEVTTPGGCTIAGVLRLEAGGVRTALAAAVAEAARVASGLGKA